MIFKVWSRDIPLLTVSVRVPVTVVNIVTKSNLEKKDFISSYSLQSTIEGSDDPKAGTEAEAMEEYCHWPAPHGVCSLLSYTPRDQGWHILQ